MRQILDAKQEELVREVRRLLRELNTLLVESGGNRDELVRLAESIDQLDQLFLIVVVGEFNSGKSTLINALLGLELLAEGVTPTTQRIHRIDFGSELDRRIETGGIEHVRAPVDVLRDLTIVDTPGTNAIERHHETITRDFVPRADLVLFVTSADRPFSESERVFMGTIKGWGKKLVFAINKVDILATDVQIQEVVDFVSQNALRVLDEQPPVFAVAARAALEAKTSGSTAKDTTSSGFSDLEQYLTDTLDDDEKLRLKLANPLGVGSRLCSAQIEATRSRLELLGEDQQALDSIEAQFEHYRSDMQREFRFRLSDVDAILLGLERRGNEYFDETLRLPRAVDLFNKAKIQSDFERQVIGDAPKQIETKVHEVIDWMVASELRQWKGINQTIEARRSLHRDSLIGEIGSFDYDREQLLGTVGRAANSTIEAFDQQTESARMAESVRTAVAGAALIEVGALSLGTLVTMAATTQLADFTGLLAAGTLAVMGLLVLPARRRRAKREMADKIRELRENLMTSLTEQFDRELDRSVHRISDAIAPYSRFVRSERGRLRDSIETLEAALDRIQGLELRIDQM